MFVDFFFVLQGYYIIKSNDNMDYDPWEYFKGRVMRFFPIVFFVVIAYIIWNILCGNWDRVGGDFFNLTFSSQLVIPELVNGNCNMLWFLSASMIAGTVMVWIAAHCNKNSYIVFTIVSLVLYSDLLSKFGSLDVWWQRGFICQSGIIRAFAGVMLGMFLRQLSIKLYDKEMGQIAIWISRILVIAIIICTVIFICVKHHSVYDLYVIIWLSIIILILNLPSNVIQIKFTNLLDRLCLPMYVLQIPLLTVVSKLTQAKYIGAMLIVIADILLSTLWIYFPWKKIINYVIRKG